MRTETINMKENKMKTFLITLVLTLLIVVGCSKNPVNSIDPYSIKYNGGEPIVIDSTIEFGNLGPTSGLGGGNQSDMGGQIDTSVLVIASKMIKQDIGVTWDVTNLIITADSILDRTSVRIILSTDKDFYGHIVVIYGKMNAFFATKFRWTGLYDEYTDSWTMIDLRWNWEPTMDIPRITPDNLDVITTNPEF